MTELAIRRDNAVSLIQDTARDLAAAMQIATALVRTPFVPQHFRGKPEDAAAAILYGATIDMDPTTALQNIYVVSGKPALYARTMVAIVLSHGHEIWTEEESEGTVTVCGQRKGSSRTEKVTWNTEMAKRAGYTSNKKYQTDPRSMLYARASGDIARRVAPDALLGMGYTREELELEGELADERPAVRARSSVSRLRTAITAAPEPQTEPEPEESAESEEQPVTPEQLSRLGALLKEQGYTDRTEGLEFLEKKAGRKVGASKELTEAEAGTVIAALEAMDGPVDAEIVPDDVDIDNDPVAPEDAS